MGFSPRYLLLVALLCVWRSPAVAGTFPRCDPPPTIESRVAETAIIVVARAAGPSAVVDRTELRTRFTIEQTLKGSVRGKVITVSDCLGWKCNGQRWKRGQRAVLFLYPPIGDPTYSLASKSCREGFTRGSLAYDPKAPEVQRVFAAAGVPLPAP